MIHVIATIQIAAGRRADFLREFQQLVPFVRAEEGCIEYGPAIDLDAGIAGQPAARGRCRHRRRKMGECCGTQRLTWRHPTC